MAEAMKKAAAPKKAVATARRATDKRTTGTAKNPKKVTAASASTYKAIKPVKVTKGKAGRPRKAQ